MVWEGVEESFEVAAPGSAVHISGRFGVHPQYGPKITVETIRRARPDEFEGADLADGPSVPVERLEADLRELLETVQNPQLRELLDRFFGDGSPRLGAVPRGAGREVLPPGLPPRAARAHASRWPRR